MKLRTGFVSNSSSSSFCLCKSHMTEEQIKQFRTYTEEWTYNTETYIHEGKYAFFGEISHHVEPSIGQVMHKIGVDARLAEMDY